MTKHNFRIRESSCFYELTDTLSERGNKFVRFDDSLGDETYFWKK